MEPLAPSEAPEVLNLTEHEEWDCIADTTMQERRRTLAWCPDGSSRRRGASEPGQSKVDGTEGTSLKKGDVDPRSRDTGGADCNQRSSSHFKSFGKQFDSVCAREVERLG